MPTDKDKAQTGTGDGEKSESSFSIVNFLSTMICGGYAIAMPLWMWWPTEAKPEVLAIINQMMGAWQMAFATVIAYHFGSSKDTKTAAAANRDALTSMTSTVATTAATAATVAATASGTPPVVNGVVETATWNDAVAAGTAEAFEGYLTRFPTGVHAVEAKARLSALKP